MSKCMCISCECLRSHKRLGNTRTEYYCGHENQRYIDAYYRQKKIQSMPGFIGFGKAEFPRKTTPKWCPKEK
jgi:hypothetical protein